MAAKIMLYTGENGGGVPTEFTGSKPNMLTVGAYHSAMVKHGQWTLFKEINYEDSGAAYKLILRVADGLVDLPFVPGSIKVD